MKHVSKRSLIRRISSSVCAAVMTITTIFSGVTFASAATSQGRKIDVWDFGGVQEADTSMYDNQIASNFWDDYDKLGDNGRFIQAKSEVDSITWGDLTLTYIGQDRVYRDASTKTAGLNNIAQTKYDDGYNAKGMYYCNGTGSDKSRCMDIANVKAGDKIVVYMGASNAAESTIYFRYENSDGTKSQLEGQPFTNVGGKHEFVAQYDGTYKIYPDKAAGKPVYNRIIRIPGVAVTGKVDTQGNNLSDYVLRFTSNSTGATTDATVDANGNYSVTLGADEEYTVNVYGAKGFGTTQDTKTIKTSRKDAITGIANRTIKIEEKSLYSYTGKITGFDPSYDISKLSVIMKTDEDSMAEDVVLSIEADGSFSASLEAEENYTAQLKGVNDYEVIKGGVVNSKTAVTQDIEVALKPKYEVKGSFTGLNGTTPTSLKFVNLEDSYEYLATITANGYSVALRDGSYKTVVEINGYRTTTHVVVSGANVEKDLMFVSTTAKAALDRVSDLYVGYEDKGSLNYNTVSEAVEAASLMKPSSEDERITIHIAPGTYREQIKVNTPYISFVNDSNEEVKLTWYYGIGYKYYSIDDTGFYNPENAYDKFDKGAANKWGASVYVTGNADYFRADGITFEASFNRYLTDEELEDGVVSDGSIAFVRRYGADVTSKSATERSTAFAVEATDVEMTNCSFLGSQDTLYTGNTDARLYFLNCHVEGNTDYIFGDGNCVFDACDLCFYGYSTGSVGGYITAMKPSASAGYLFRNCTISGNDNLTVSKSYLGRPWGSNANVTFLNTKVCGDLILDAGYTTMSSNKPENAKYREYGTVYTDGTACDLSKRVTGVIDENTANSIKLSDYFADWTPVSLVKEADGVRFVKDPYIVDNGDMNAPYPGHVLTACYDLGDNMAADASIIRWYIVSDDGSRTLVKTSTASSDRTYKITDEAVSKHICLEVEPQTISGQKGETKTITLEAFVREGYEDPTGKVTDPTVGDGINIFLAGDSTVKDYSTKGMYNGGKSQSEGSWGEYLQDYFDSDYVNVVNYANGGRSTRNFINEGTLDKIAANISKGDYLFIQFGHNDCANEIGYREDRYVPLGQPDANGIFPVTAGQKVDTPSSLKDKYGDTYYSYDCGATYKWYLLQYINVARQVGATPVLVTPVARLYFTTEGTIRPHHDASDATDTYAGSYVPAVKYNSYVEAVRQLAQEENVMLIDEFQITKDLYEKTYKEDSSAANGVSPAASKLLCDGDSTHSSKLGGFVSAGLMAQDIQNKNLNISKFVLKPTKTSGVKANGTVEFTVNKDGVIDTDVPQLKNYTQNLLDSINAKAEELSKEETPDTPEVPDTPETPSQGDDSASHTVWVIGDSTVSSFNDAYYYPRYGYGTMLSKYFTDNITVKNLALSGRSSKSYVNDKEYKELIDGMQEGDYLIIGFGHNDEKNEPDRYTSPSADINEAGTFGNSLYENYIKIAKEKGVTVILDTPIVRRSADGNWSASNLHQANGGDYAQVIRDLGANLGLTVIDMTNITKNLYDELGPSETLYLHAWTSKDPSSVDNTHINIYGAKLLDYYLTQAIKNSDNSLAKYVKDLTKPTKEADLVVNPEYKEASYEPIADGQVSSLWKNVGIWSGSVFGNVGGDDKITNSNFVLEEVEGGIRIAALNGNGKIAGTNEGLAMYYYKVPVGKNFTLQATANVNAVTLNDQVSFGLMARDDMYLDKALTETMGDYVAAGPLKLTKEDKWNCFARKSGTLTQGGTCSQTGSINAGDSFDLKIESNSDGYACTFGNEQTITAGFDFALTSNDPNYVYVGMFVSRKADVTFTNISLVVDGVQVYGEAKTPSEEPSENPSETPSENPSENPSETPSENPSENPSETPSDSGEIAGDQGKVYEMLEGGNLSLVKGEAKELVLRSAADFALFKGVYVDGELLDESNYTAKAGSTIIRLAADYVATLSEGEHEIKIVSEDGEAVAKISVAASEAVIGDETANEVAADTAVVEAAITDTATVAETTTTTADTNALRLYLILALASMTLLAANLKSSKGKENR